MKRLFATDDSWKNLVLRAAVGLVIFPHGAQKMLGWFGGHGFSATMGYFTHNGMPGVLAFLVIVGEFLGSVALVAGFLSRVAAGGIGIIMLGAALTVHLGNGFFMNWLGAQKGEGIEYFLLIVPMLALVVVYGGGRWSLDRIIARRLAEAGSEGVGHPRAVTT